MLGLSILSFFLFGPISYAQFLPYDLSEKMFPSVQSNMTEQEFRDIIRKVQTTFAPIVKQHGGNLSVSGDWKSEKLNAGAQQMMGSWRVVISGALARRPELTPDGFTLILCHELGHHLAGFSFAQPRTPMEGIWAANEGQSDFFASHSCARTLWREESAKNREFRATVTPYVQERCDSVFGGENEQNLCYRINAGNESVIKTMAALMKKEAPKFETPNPTKVEKTVDGHPEIQCRLDTAFAGSLCALDNDYLRIPGKDLKGKQFSSEAEWDSVNYSCHQIHRYVLGTRPHCWFRSQL